METTGVTMPREQARELYRKYRAHVHYSTPIDDEVRRAYQLLAQGRLLVRAIDSVVQAGLGADGFPKLALCRADKPACRVNINDDGSATMYAEGYAVPWRNPSKPNACLFQFRSGTFTRGNVKYGGRAIMPLIPLEHRPKRGLANYHVLWEAEWSRVAPRDPFLLRRIGKADLWLVVAMWDLTDVERAVMQARIPTA